MRARKAIRAVALFEAFKGSVAVLAGSGLLFFVHHDLQEVAMRLVEHAHLNPAAHYPGIFIAAARHFENLPLVLLACGAATYASVRFVEAYGLWFEKAWAEVLAAASGALYVPFEVLELVRRPRLLGLVLLILNLLVVILMLWVLRARRKNSGAISGEGAGSS
ncbi:DUF2127 domain-containing protein [Niveibacterium sp. SC-1]|uniref:DUF2127 domain-containing protein n=1 Tax=Niveibacterium sp. SC-1 TaxID=3135646 RepID=UPI0031203EE8